MKWIACALFGSATFFSTPAPAQPGDPAVGQLSEDKNTPARQRKTPNSEQPKRSKKVSRPQDGDPASEDVAPTPPAETAIQPITAEEVLLRFQGSLQEEIENPPPVFALYFDDTDSRYVQMSQSPSRSTKAQYAVIKSRSAARYNRFVSEVFPGADLWVDSAGRRISSNTRSVNLTPRRILWLLADDAGPYASQVQTWIRQMRPPVVGAAIDAIVNMDDLLAEHAGESMELAQLLWLSNRAREAITNLATASQVSVDDQQALKRFLTECGIEREDTDW